MSARSTPVPQQALEQHVAIVGKTGSGKTYAARGLVDELDGRVQLTTALTET